MNRKLIDILACPVDGDQFELHNLSSQHSKESDLIETGVLFCKSCSRWFPIKDSIPSILPDALREPEENEFLKKYKNRLPDEILTNGLPININTVADHESKNEVEKVDQKKLQEIAARDKSVNTYDSHFSTYQNEIEPEMTLKSFRPTKTDIILDLGVGTGRFLERYLDRCGSVIGIDFSFQSLKWAKERYQSTFDKKIAFLQVDISFLPFKENAFDKAISTQVIQHLPSQALRQKTISGIAKVLKEGGEFICSATNYSIQKRFYERLGKVDFVKKETTIMDGKVYCFNFKAAELKKLFYSDFKVEKIHGILNWIPKLSKYLGRYRKYLDYMIARTPLSIWLGDILLIKGKKC